MAATKDGYRGGAQGSPVSKVFGGNGKNHDGGSVSKAIAGGANILNGTGDRDQWKSPPTPKSNMSRSAHAGGSTTPSAARRRSGG